MARLSRKINHEGTYTSKDGNKVPARIQWSTENNGWQILDSKTGNPIHDSVVPTLANSGFETKKN